MAEMSDKLLLAFVAGVGIGALVTLLIVRGVLNEVCSALSKLRSEVRSIGYGD